MNFRVAFLLFAAVFSSVPALADSYALVTFDELTPDPGFGYQPDPRTVTYPFATFAGGSVQGSSGSNIYETTDTGRFSPDLSFYIAPDFKVHEVRFTLDFFDYYESPDSLLIDVQTDSLPFDVAFTGFGERMIDLVSADNIEIVDIFTPPYYLGWVISLDNVAFNPSLAPVATTPEPPSVVLIGSALLGSAMMWWIRRKRGDSALV